MNQIDAIKNGEYVICSCEGAAEKAIITLLLEHDCLIFTESNLLDNGLTRLRSAKKIEQEFLHQDFDKIVHIIRIVDSKKEKFKLSKVYRDENSQVDEHPIDIHTHPEIEILVIIASGKYNDFQQCKNRELPSGYCNRVISDGIDVKSEKFINKYFEDINCLLRAIKEYKRLSCIGRSERCLYDLLNDETKQSILI